MKKGESVRERKKERKKERRREAGRRGFFNSFSFSLLSLVTSFIFFLLLLSSSGSRYGLYAPIRDLLATEGEKQVPFWKKFVAGGGSGALASFMANPTDLMKVRLQVDGMGGKPRRYFFKT